MVGFLSNRPFVDQAGVKRPVEHALDVGRLKACRRPGAQGAHPIGDGWVALGNDLHLRHRGEAFMQIAVSLHGLMCFAWCFPS
jgi:hypothetical protein